MLSYLIVLVKMLTTGMLFVEMAGLSFVNILNIADELYPFMIRSYILAFAFYDNIYLTRFLLCFVGLMWGCMILLMFLGLFSPAIRKITIAFSCFTMCFETISVLFINDFPEMICELTVNMVLFGLTVVSLLKSQKSR